MKLNDIHNIAMLYYRVSDRKDLNIKSAYKLLKFFNLIQDDENFYQLKFAEIINKYADRDEDGNPIVLEDGTSVKIIEERVKDCQKELDDLANIEVTSPNIEFTLDEIPEGLSLKELNWFVPFIKEKE